MIAIWKRACRKARERLQASADAGDGAGTDPETLSHVEGCADCSRFLELLKSLGAGLRGELDARLNGETQPAGGSQDVRRISRPRPIRWKLAGVAAAAVLFCSLGLYLATSLPSRAPVSAGDWTDEIFVASPLDGLEAATSRTLDTGDLAEWLLDLPRNI